MAARPLAGKVVLVTGASRGIGAATARELAARGAHVGLVARDGAALATVAAQLPGEHVHVVGDVRSQEDMDRAVAAVVDRFGRLDIVFANAGVVSYGSVLLTGAEEMERVLDTNVTGAYRTVRAALPHLRASRGYVLFMGSISAITSVGGLGPYAASKSGLEAWSHVLALELRDSGVRVGMLYSSWVDTDLIADAEHAMPSFGRVRRLWELPARVPGMGWWPGGTASPEKAAALACDAMVWRARRVWLPFGLAGLSLVRHALNGPYAEAVMGVLFGRTTRRTDAEVLAARGDSGTRTAA